MNVRIGARMDEQEGQGADGRAGGSGRGRTSGLEEGVEEGLCNNERFWPH